MSGVFVIGHSHMVCLLEAARDAGVPFQAVALKTTGDEDQKSTASLSILTEDTGKPDFREDTKTIISGTTGPVYSFISGIMHVELGLQRLDEPSEPAFDFVLPEAPGAGLDAEAEIIPSDAMREVLRRRFKTRLKMLTRLAALAPGRVVQFVPPPPVSDRWLAPLLDKRSVKATVLPNRWVRWKLWRLAADIFRQHASEQGARFVDAPPAALDGDGFLRDELVRNATHGNAAFGALLLDQIRARR
jgi:hypothetical protein